MFSIPDRKWGPPELREFLAKLFKKTVREPPLVLTSKPVPVRDIWEKPRLTLQLLLSAGLHLAAAALLFFTFKNQIKEAVKGTVSLVLPFDISVYLPTPAQKPGASGGGGGGGDRSPLPASKGKLPKFKLEQFTPPVAKIINQNPKLIMDPSVVVPPDIQFNNPNMVQFGDPAGALGPLSNGPGSGGGIGKGSGGGVGSGMGPGVGPGSGGGIGGGAFRVGGGVTAPQVIYRVNPEYSEEARKAKHQGVVELYIEVEPDGLAHRIIVRRSLGLGLDEKAIEAVKQWKFKPGLKDGKPVTVGALITVTFRLL